jgi:acetate kinase
MGVVVAVNAGSSSVKLSVYVLNGTTPSQIADAEVSSLGSDNSKIKYSRHGKSVIEGEKAGEAGKDHDAAFASILDRLVSDSELNEVGNKDCFSMICHRIVHGGDYEDIQVINKDTYQTLEELSDLAPLHNGSALKIVQSCFNQLPNSKNVACFDSQFHMAIPKHIATYPINQDVAKKNGLRKYGFHGLSYAYIAREVAQHLKKNVDDLNIIALHLGSGASACAIKQGKSWDTSMGLTPLSGLPGATRSGSIDPR